MCQGRRSCFADYKVGEAQTLWRRCEKPIAALVDGVAPSLALVIISIQPLGKGATPLPDEPELPTDASPLSEAPRAAGEAAENAPLFPYDSEPLIPQISFAPPQRWRLLIEGAVRVTYDDNITRQESNEQSDVVFALAPRVSVEVGDFRDKTENFLIFTGAPTAFHFLENTVEDTIDYDASFEAQAAFSKLILSAKLRFQLLSDSEIDVGRRTRRQVYAASLGALYALTARSPRS